MITQVTSSWAKVPTGEDSLLKFLAQPASSKSYLFTVQQTYSDGSIVNWSGPESSDAPAPSIEARSSLGGGGTPLVAILALVLAGLGLLAGGIAALGGGARAGGRPLA